MEPGRKSDAATSKVRCVFCKYGEVEPETQRCMNCGMDNEDWLSDDLWRDLWQTIQKLRALADHIASLPEPTNRSLLDPPTPAIAARQLRTTAEILEQFRKRGA